MANIGKADKVMTQVFSLIPYKYYAPGKLDDGKYVFQISKPNAVTATDKFQPANYYSEIERDVLNRNPLITKNPGHL